MMEMVIIHDAGYDTVLYLQPSTRGLARQDGLMHSDGTMHASIFPSFFFFL